jgi:TRAP-type C4-dicarboxylate transport system substrate-binding protein
MLKKSLIAAVFVGAATAAAAQTKWDLPSAYPISNFHTENLMQFIADVDKNSAGKLKIQAHPNASLFKAPEIKRAVQSGQVQAGEVILNNFENENPLFGLDGVPFLATSYADAFKLYQAQKPALEKLLAASNIKLLYTVPWQPQGMYANKQVNGAADMVGLKWRAYSPATLRLAELAKAQPVQIQAAELSQALATGVVDSYMSSSSTGYDSKTYEHIKNFYNVQAWLPKNMVMVNLRAFNGLDKPTQEALLKAAAAAEERGWKLSQDKNAWYLDQLKARGMNIIEPSAALNADFRKMGDTMLADWLKKAGADGKAIVDAYRK